MNLPVILNLVQSSLFQVCFAYTHQVLNNFNISFLASNEERRASVAYSADNFLSVSSLNTL